MMGHDLIIKFYSSAEATAVRSFVQLQNLSCSSDAAVENNMQEAKINCLLIRAYSNESLVMTVSFFLPQDTSWRERH